MSDSLPVVILVGGAGTRLGRQGEVLPKALVEVGDRPILWHVMKIVNRAVGKRSGPLEGLEVIGGQWSMISLAAGQPGDT
jgi:CTP:molybdopterin cytidylyltransferase MocA